jgi:oligoribonuclease
MTGMKDRAEELYVWFDTEYSDLDLDGARLLQVAALITDSSLKRVLPQAEDVRLTIRLPDDAIISPWVEQNLPELLRACRSPEAVDVEEADLRLAHYVDAVAGPPAEQENQRPVLAGNSVHEDWFLARRFLPRFIRRLHYRHLDVTALKLEWERLHPDEKFGKDDPAIVLQYFPDSALPGSGRRHDACYDVHASVAELAFYRRFLLGSGS